MMRKDAVSALRRPLATSLLITMTLLLAVTTFTSCAPAVGAGGVTPTGAAPSPTGVLGGLLSPTPSPAKPTPTARPRPAGYLHTDGSKLVDAEGHEATLTGINWFGMESGTYAPHGVWARNWQDMLDQVDKLGYNVIRLPYSNDLLDPNARPLEGVDFKLNPDLRGLTGIQIMDKIIEGAGQRGIKVILDRHRPTSAAQTKLWYSDNVSEQQWIADWQFLAQRYKNNDTVIGADLHNEPAGDATWGDGNPKTDWRLAAERAGNAVLETNPNWLIIVEGVEKQPNDWYWMGGNLRAAADAPVRLNVPNRLVYSAHDYGPGVFNQGWFQDKAFPSNLAAVWDAHWGYLVKQNVAPVLVGEFGGKSVGSDTEGVWQRTLLDYLKQNHISYTYWSLNPNSVDTGGILNDDWTTVNQAKQNMLASYQAPKLYVGYPSFVDKSGTPVARKNPLPEQPVKVLVRTTKPASQSDEIAVEMQIVNQTNSRVPINNLALDYWYAAPGVDRSQQAVSVDWSSVDSKQLKVELVSDNRGGQTYRIAVTFGADAGMIPAKGVAEVKLRVKRLDKGTYDQASAFSFQPTGNYTDDSHVALYFWDKLLWGQEPK